MTHEEEHDRSWNPPEGFLAHLRRPHNLGDNPGADGQAAQINGCGESLAIWIEVDRQRVRRAGFLVNACVNVAVAGSAVATLAEGMGVTDLKNLTVADVLQELGGLPPGEEHCAQFALETLRRALVDHLIRRKEEPWKRLYR